jgi:hypothetical protein
MTYLSKEKKVAIFIFAKLKFEGNNILGCPEFDPISLVDANTMI